MAYTGYVGPFTSLCCFCGHPYLAHYQDSWIPVPVAANAVFRVFADAIVSEAKRRGPSTAYLAKMAVAGYEEEISRAIYAYVFEEGIKSE